MGLPVSPCASHLPLGPDGVGLDGTPNDLDVDVRDERKDLLPIPAHLSSAAKASGWMCRSLVLVVLGKARCQGLEIMLVRHAHQPIDRRKRLHHAFPPRFHSSRLEPMASMGRKSRAVKGRSYDASLRREQARRNHDRIIEMAQRRCRHMSPMRESSSRAGECSSPRSLPWPLRSCSWCAMPPAVTRSSSTYSRRCMRTASVA